MLLISVQSFSQNEEWFDFELDSTLKVTFKLPVEEANLFDSVQDGIKMYEISAEKNGVIYYGNKMLLSDLSLPNNIDDLKSIYDEASPTSSKNYPNTIASKTKIEKNKLIGQKLTLTDSIGNRLYESEVYLLNNKLFLFSCFSKENSPTENSNYFFDSVSLPKNSESMQLTGKSNFLKIVSVYKTGILIFIGLVLLVLGIIIIKRHPKR